MSRIRITGGTWRSRLIDVAGLPGLRPTPDRVRETLFNWLGQDLTGLACLDLFAGSGILAFEAASRGANGVVMVDSNSRAVSTLRRNLASLGNDPRLAVVQADAIEFAALAVRRGQRFDLVFVDPPYRQGWLERLWPQLSALVAKDGSVYVEAEAEVVPPEDWQTLRQGRAGQVHYHLLQLRDAPQQP